MRLLLDESLPVEATSVLREAGHDVATVVGRNLDGYGDAALLAACRRDQRTLVTLTRGFSGTDHRSGVDPRIIVLSLPRVGRASAAAAITALLDPISVSDPPGGVWVVEVDGSSVRVVFPTEDSITSQHGGAASSVASGE